MHMSMMPNEHGMNICNEWRKSNAGKFEIVAAFCVSHIKKITGSQLTLENK